MKSLADLKASVLSDAITKHTGHSRSLDNLALRFVSSESNIFLFEGPGPGLDDESASPTFDFILISLLNS